MNEEQLTPITEENSNIKIKPATINLPQKKEPEIKNKETIETINNLPTWSIEPPLEIKRGN